MSARVGIIGSGLAGLVSAATASASGAHVTVFDKQPRFGGNSAKATSGINGIHTPAQQKAGVSDSLEQFAADTMKSGHQLSDEALVATLCSKSTEALAFIEKTAKIELNGLLQCGGHTVARTHREVREDGKPAPIGWDIVKGMRDALEELPNVRFEFDANVDKVIRNSTGVVTGVSFTRNGESLQSEFDAVILASGGYGADCSGETSLLAEFAPHLASLPSTNGSFATGDGVKLARAIGAHLHDMDKVQVHPTGFVDPTDPHSGTKFLAPEALRGCGAVLVNGSGQRFVNELAPRDVVSAAIFDKSAADGTEATPSSGVPRLKPRPTRTMLVMTQAGVDQFGPNFGFYWRVKHFFECFDSVAAAAVRIGCDEATLSATLQEYKQAADGSKPDPHGKTVFPDKFESLTAIYIAEITPAIHYTMGGVSINAAAEVLEADTMEANLLEHVLRSAATGGNNDDVALMDAAASDICGSSSAELTTVMRPIPRLFACGEVTSGVHGGNRLAGNSLLECVVFGRIAGARAAAVNAAAEPCLSSDSFTALELREKHNLGAGIALLRFNLPSPMHRAGLECGEYLAVRMTDASGEDVVRFYSPISRSDALGHLDLLIKADPKGGTMSHYLTGMQPGGKLDIKGPLGGVKLQFDHSAPIHPDRNVKKLGLIAGGTGISPMCQILRSIFFHDRSDVEVDMLYGGTSPTGLVFRDLLELRAKSHPNFKLHMTVDEAVAADQWTGRVGFIGEAMLKECLPPPSDDLLVVVCGPWKMCQVIKAHLASLGYTPEMVYSYM